MAVNNNKLKNIYLYSRYERFWHWLQSALIVLLLITGFEIKGLYTLFGFQAAVKVHNFVGNTWLIAFLFFAFWLFTTGEWKQYIPTTKKMLLVLRYYLYGIFRGEHIRFPSKEKPNTIHYSESPICSWRPYCFRFKWPPGCCTGVTTRGLNGGWPDYLFKWWP